MNKRAPQETKTRLAELEFLSRAIESFGIPVREAERLVLSADVPWFAKGLEKRVRALSKFFDAYLAKHPDALRRGDDPGNESVVERELAYARESLSFIMRIGRTVAEPRASKSDTAFAREKNKRLAARQGSATDFSVESEELRKLRAGELKPEPPSDSPRPRP